MNEPGEKWRCPNDTDWDGDCHLCARSACEVFHTMRAKARRTTYRDFSEMIRDLDPHPEAMRGLLAAKGMFCHPDDAKESLRRMIASMGDEEELVKLHFDHERAR